MFRNDLVVTRLIGTKNSWRLKKSLIWQTDNDTVIVPEGFIYDGASVPKVFTRLFPIAGEKYDRASCLHDWLYLIQDRTRKEADKVFYRAMISDGVSSLKAKSMYNAVRFGGSSAWKSHTDKDREKIKELI